MTAKTTERPQVARMTPSTSAEEDVAANGPGPEQRAASGKAARAKAPLDAHRRVPPAVHPRPGGLLLDQATTRVPAVDADPPRPDVGVALHVLPGRGAADGR